MGRGLPNTVWRFATGGYVKFGSGAASDAGFEAKRLGARRVLVVTDKGISATGMAEEIKTCLKNEKLVVSVWDRCQSEPTVELVQSCYTEVREQSPDVVVGLGGGSAMDIAKTVRMLLVHGGEALDYIRAPLGKGKQFPGKGVPMIAVPTTSGTGSEATSVSVMAVGSMKTGISQTYMLPEVALVDPSLTVGMPPQVTAATGVDVLCHAAEAYVARRFDQNPSPEGPETRPANGTNPLSDLIAGESIRLVGENLRRAVNQGRDIQARSAMSLASFLGGMAIESGGVSVPHAVGHVIGGKLHVAHGIACGVVLPYFLDYAACADIERFSRLSSFLDPTGASHGASRDSAQMAAWLTKELLKDIGIASNLREVGVKESDLEDIGQETLKKMAWAIPLSPRLITNDAIAEILTNAFEGRLCCNC